MGFTRRSHIVRIKGKPIRDGAKPPYADIEVLDAIEFRTTNNREMVLNFKPENVKPYIVDNTIDDGNGKNTNTKTVYGAKSTRLSHMKRITGVVDSQGTDHSSSYFDIEVLDIVAFRDENGKEWILNMPSSSANPFDTTQGAADSGGKGTRRSHLEVIKGKIHGSGGTAGGSGGGDTPISMTVERVDTIGFRTVLGEELVIKCPSADDGSGSRASTFTTPQGYDASTGLPEPPANTDPNVYFAFVNKTTPGQPTIISPGIHAWAFITKDIGPGAINGQFFSAAIYASAAQAQAAGEAVVNANTGQVHNLIAPVTVEFVNTPPIYGPPGPSQLTQGGLDTGGMDSNPKKTTKISMGPLWWVRRIDGGDA